MKITDLTTQILVVLVIVGIFPWLFLKTARIAWRVILTSLIFLVLLVALPGVRAWIFNLF